MPGPKKIATRTEGGVPLSTTQASWSIALRFGKGEVHLGNRFEARPVNSESRSRGCDLDSLQADILELGHEPAPPLRGGRTTTVGPASPHCGRMSHAARLHHLRDPSRTPSCGPARRMARRL